MTLATQVRLANDVAAQFRHLPPDEAVARVVTHLRSFWDPRMIAQLGAAAAADDGDLDPIAVAAAQRLGGSAG
jgi:formate dehydrogenase subunit delta